MRSAWLPKCGLFLRKPAQGADSQVQLSDNAVDSADVRRFRDAGAAPVQFSGDNAVVLVPREMSLRVATSRRKIAPCRGVDSRVAMPRRKVASCRDSVYARAA